MNHSDPYMLFYFSLVCVVILFKKGDKVLLIHLVQSMYYSAQHCTVLPSLD